MKTNKVKHSVNETFEGGRAANLTPKERLEHLVLACLLWEDTFYEDGKSIVEQIKDAVLKCSVKDVMEIAEKAKFEQKLRHAPLWILVSLVSKLKNEKDKGDFNTSFVSKFLTRADDMGELISLYKIQEGDKAPIPNIFKKAISQALGKFDEYQLAKYASKKANYRLVDVVNLCHPKSNEAISKLIKGELQTPDTWEVAISAAGNDQKKKAKEWKRLVTENVIPDMAFLMNIRNIDENVDVASEIIPERINKIQSKKLLPIVYLCSGMTNPRYQVHLEQKFFEVFAGEEKQSGKTAILVDVSGSMDVKSLNYAYSLAMIAREKFKECDVYSFSNDTVKVKDLRGFKLVDAINNSQYHACTFMWKSLEEIDSKGYDRVVVITDEQAHDSQSFKPKSQVYIINVDSSARSVQSDKSIVKITGFSDRVFDYIENRENS